MPYKSRTTPEAKVKAAVDALLKRHKLWYFKPVSNGMGKHGVPDFIVCMQGHFVAIECKGNDNLAPTKLQEIQLSQIQKAGGTTFVVGPNSINDLEVWLSGVENDATSI